jgi:hypothetical protein
MRFIDSDPFALSLAICRECGNVTDLVQKALSTHGGIRFVPKIAGQAEANLEWLEDQWWPQVDEVLNRLIVADDPMVEREAARFIDHNFEGFGPKQARNLLQMLGLTRYEIPLDSRIAKWFNKFGFPIRLSTGALADEGVYEFLSDGIQELCRRSGVYPCVLDGAVFVSFDGDASSTAWDSLNQILW